MSQDTAPNPIAAALVAARSGQQAEAARILADFTKSPKRHDSPIGFVVNVLRQTGCTALAEWLVARALSRGLDVVSVQPGFDAILAGTNAAAARTICRRYEQAFAAGLVNAVMVGRYAIALSRAGEWDALAALYPRDGTVLQLQLDTVDGFDDLAAFNDSVVQDIRDHAEEELLDGRNYMEGAVRYHKVDRIDRPAIRRLIEIAGRAFDDFAPAGAFSPDHPLERMRPSDRNIVAWANVYDTGSFVRPHLHHEGWLVAVYYPRVPDVTGGPEDAGALKVTCPAHCGGIERPGPDPVWPETTIRPTPGLLVVMPAYCFHHSVPFTGSGERVAVTIDWNVDPRARSAPFVPEV